MTTQSIVAARLGRLLGALAHPQRLLIVLQLGHAERDVATLQRVIGIRHSAASQHLARLRSDALVVERREGRHVYYRLVRPELAAWVAEGLRFIEPRDDDGELREAVRQARAAWTTTPESDGSQSPEE